MSGEMVPTLDDLFEVAAQLRARGLREQAEAILRHIVEEHPDHADAHNHLGLISAERDELEQALIHATAAAEAAPDAAKLHANLAMVLTDMGSFAEAEAAYRQALTLEPEHQSAQSGLGQLLLLQERREGFAHYRKLKKPYDFAGAPICFWNGEPLDGKSLLVLRAQGLGEEIHASRYYGQLLETCRKVTVVCDRRLTDLLSSSWPGLQVIAGDDAGRLGASAGRVDYVCYITDLVALLPDPGVAGYLCADLAQTSELRGKYQRRYRGKRLVGIAWQTSSRLRPAARSVPLEKWAEILNLPDCQFFSLQYGMQERSIPRLTDAVDETLVMDPDVDATNDINGLAAQISAMDQIISIDNSTVHLAGALGKPVWTLLMDVPYWMWGLKGERTDWYPSMRLLRQGKRGDWPPVLNAVARELESGLAMPATAKPAAPEVYLAAIGQKFEAGDYLAADALLSDLDRAHPGHERHARWTALCLFRQDRLEEALPWAEKALAEEPENVENHRALGSVLQAFLDFDEAERILSEGLEMMPDRADLRSILFGQLMLQRRFEEAWTLYGPADQAFARQRMVPARRWEGETLEDATLHLWALEGVGDFPLALTLLDEIEKQAGRLVLECDKRLHPLIRRTGTTAELHPLRAVKGGRPNRVLGDVHSTERWAIGTLAPDLCVGDLATSRLIPDQERAAGLRARYRRMFPGKPLVGLSWYSTSVAQGIARSLRPADLEPLLADANCQFIDLQYQNPNCPMPDYHLKPGRLYRDDTVDSWADFDGLAAQLAALDLTITIDNSTAQIAGAIGAPCWTLLHTLPDWRWGLTDDTCSLYPDMRLFRQRDRQDWSAPIQKICASLARLERPVAAAV